MKRVISAILFLSCVLTMGVASATASMNVVSSGFSADLLTYEIEFTDSVNVNSISAIRVNGLEVSGVISQKNNLSIPSAAIPFGDSVIALSGVKGNGEGVCDENITIKKNPRLTFTDMNDMPISVITSDLTGVKVKAEIEGEYEIFIAAYSKDGVAMKVVKGDTLEFDSGCNAEKCSKIKCMTVTSVGDLQPLITIAEGSISSASLYNISDSVDCVLTYTSDVELDVNTVTAKNYSVTSIDGEKTEVIAAYYYPMSRQVLLELKANKDAINKTYLLATENVKDKDGNLATTYMQAYIVPRDNSSYTDVKISKTAFIKDFTPLLSTAGQTDFEISVRIINPTVQNVTGYVKVFDGNIYITKEPYSIKSDGFAEITVINRGYTFKNEARIELD